MKILLQILTLAFIFITVSSLVNSEVLWEKEFAPINFVYPEVSERLYECGNSYYIFYYGYDKESVQIVNEQITGKRYPSLLKINENGNTIYQNETIIPMIDSLRDAGIKTGYQVRAYKYSGNELLFDIPQLKGVDRGSNFYSFSNIDGSLINIVGTGTSYYQWHQGYTGFFSETEEFVLGDPLLFGDPSRIDVNSIIADENNYTLKYRILLNMDAFKDSVQEGTFANDFLMVDDHSFIAKFKGQDNNNIIAKYSYDKAAAINLPTGGQLNADLIWFTIYKHIENVGFKQFLLLDNGNILVNHSNGCLAILNNEGEIIFNKKVFDDTYKDYSLTNVMPLKFHTGYFAFWGYFTNGSDKNFAVIITDSDWNVVDAVHWDYNTKTNKVTDIKEKENGNLIVYGKSIYPELQNTNIPYYAELKPNYVSVKDQNSNIPIEVAPNPADDYINISNINYGENIEIYNLLGMKQIETVYNGKINISNLPVGVYYLKVGNQTEMFIKSN